jgi:hypothetical protein
MTKDQFFQKYVMMLERRMTQTPPPSQQARDAFDALKREGRPGLNKWGKSLAAIPPPAGQTAGPCRYDIGGRPFCHVLTPDDCSLLGGQPVSSCDGFPDWTTVDFSTP